MGSDGAGRLSMMGQPISCRLTQAGRGAFEACATTLC
eukprot:COSAG01_NODE_69388_length_261_cov_1.074074_1_plen_36_part_10